MTARNPGVEISVALPGMTEGAIGGWRHAWRHPGQVLAAIGAALSACARLTPRSRPLSQASRHAIGRAIVVLAGVLEEDAAREERRAGKRRARAARMPGTNVIDLASLRTRSAI